MQRRTYREAIELLRTGEHDFSWVCSFPYAKYRDEKFFGLMAVPVFEGKPLYRAYLIVHKDSQIRTLEELQGRVFAYSEPDSNTGYAVPRQMLFDAGKNPTAFFARPSSPTATRKPSRRWPSASLTARRWIPMCGSISPAANPA